MATALPSPALPAIAVDFAACLHNISSMTNSVSITDRAAQRIREIAASDPEKPIFRVAVLGGGCSGFQYEFGFAPAGEPDDILLEKDGARVVIDSVSLTLLKGSEIDFVDELIGQSFKIRNPNATSSCGCGTSFSL